MSLALDSNQISTRRPVKRGEPTWEMAIFYPLQGDWTEEEYLALHTNRLVELVDGCLEVQPMPAIWHQRIAQFLFLILHEFILARRLGEVFIAPLPVRLWPKQMREPDVLFVRPNRITDRKRPPQGVDLAIEVVSEGEENRERDFVIKRAEYAKAKIPEYWIIDAEKQRIIVLTLDGDDYRVHGEFGPGSQATSVLLPGFAVDVSAVLAAGEGPAATTDSTNGQ
jgi:Uma2 family endonuclease